MKINKGKHIKQNSEVNITRFSNPVFFLKLSLKNKKSVKKKKSTRHMGRWNFMCVVSN